MKTPRYSIERDDIDEEEELPAIFTIYVDHVGIDHEELLHVDAWAFLRQNEGGITDDREEAKQLAQGYARRIVALLNEHPMATFPADHDECCVCCECEACADEVEGA